MKLTTEIMSIHGFEAISGYELRERYEDMLNDCYPPVSICGYEYDAGRALKEIDPIAFDCGFSDYISSELDENLEEVEGEFFSKEDCDSVRESLEEGEEA
jgi:hypothetical protein